MEISNGKDQMCKVYLTSYLKLDELKIMTVM